MSGKSASAKEIRQALRPFLKRAWTLLLPEIILCAFSACGLFLLLRSFLVRAFAVRLPFVLMVPAALAAGAVYAFLHRPSWRDAARMMDAAGFQDRAVTMLDCAEQDAPMAALQRAEALSSAGRIDPRSVHRRPCARLACLSAALMLTGLLFCWTEPAPPAEPPVQGESELRAVMRQDILQSDLPEDVKRQLLADLDALPPEKEDQHSQIELLADIDAMTMEIHERQAAELLSADTLGDLMMKLPQWQALGQAFLLQNAPDAHAAMKEHQTAAVVYGSLQADYIKTLIDSLEKLIQSAAPLELEPMEKSMQAILSRLRDGLRGALDAEDAPMAATLGKFALESADAQIQELLNPKASAHDHSEHGGGQEEQEGHVMAVTGLLNAGGGTGVTGRPLTGAQEEAQKSEMYYEPTLDGTIPRNYIPGRANADGSRQRVAPDEDAPLISYGEVLGKYYAEILGMDLPDDLMDILKAYFYSL